VALDGVVVIFYSWAGLLLMAVHLAIVSGVWAVIVKPNSSGRGWSPLVVGALGSALAVLLTSALLATQQYSARSSAPNSFWETVPHWTMYLIAVVGTVSALFLTFVGVPAVAIWVRRGHRSGWSFAFLLLACGAVIITFGFGLVVPSLLGFFTGAWLMVRGHPVALSGSND
jgi:uncharacterized membrane protein YhaH (DUF805 family)